MDNVAVIDQQVAYVVVPEPTDHLELPTDPEVVVSIPNKTVVLRVV